MLKLLKAETDLPNLFTVHESPISDERGEFSRVFCQKIFLDAGIDFRVSQVNRNLSLHQFTLRGFHYQVAPFAESKFVRVLQGKILDVVVNIDSQSPHYLSSFQIELSNNGVGLLIGNNYAHGIMTLTDNVEMEYFSNNFYTPDSERGLRWDDPKLNINWPHEPSSISDKDSKWNLL
jgi:dTDP-4-dehydrorhamnose 3,5-epimerase